MAKKSSLWQPSFPQQMHSGPSMVAALELRLVFRTTLLIGSTAASNAEKYTATTRQQPNPVQKMVTAPSQPHQLINCHEWAMLLCGFVQQLQTPLASNTVLNIRRQHNRLSGPNGTIMQHILMLYIACTRGPAGASRCCKGSSNKEPQMF
jgi:hypothetical protein